MLYVLRTGIGWRDLPSWFGNWKSIYSRFNRWSSTRLWAHVLKALSERFADSEWLMVDATIMRVHQHGSGARGGQYAQAMGASRGGLSTKIHALCDSLGMPLDFIITGGERHDSTQACALLKPHLEEATAAILDAGYDSDEIRKLMNDNQVCAVIAYRKNRKNIPDFDKHIYRERHKVENYFQKIKAFRRIATRYEKLHRSFKAMLSLASIIVWMRG